MDGHGIYLYKIFSLNHSGRGHGISKLVILQTIKTRRRFCLKKVVLLMLYAHLFWVLWKVVRKSVCHIIMNNIQLLTTFWILWSSYSILKLTLNFSNIPLSQKMPIFWKIAVDNWFSHHVNLPQPFWNQMEKINCNRIKLKLQNVELVCSQTYIYKESNRLKIWKLDLYIRNYVKVYDFDTRCTSRKVDAWKFINLQRRT